MIQTAHEPFDLTTPLPVGRLSLLGSVTADPGISPKNHVTSVAKFLGAG